MTTADKQTDPIAQAIARHQSGLSAVPEAAAFHAWVAQQRGSWSTLMPGLAQAHHRLCQPGWIRAAGLGVWRRDQHDIARRPLLAVQYAQQHGL